MHIAPPAGAAAVPDARGAKLYRSDPAFARLLPLCLLADLLAVLERRLDHLGALAGGALDALRMAADRNPPELHHRTRRGGDAQSIAHHPASGEMERLAFGEFGLAAMRHRAGVFGWPAP